MKTTNLKAIAKSDLALNQAELTNVEGGYGWGSGLSNWADNFNTNFQNSYGNPLRSRASAWGNRVRPEIANYVGNNAGNIVTAPFRLIPGSGTWRRMVSRPLTNVVRYGYNQNYPGGY